mmetsp:Transcript_2648/g.4759  ORF Transcript_2648/g.4759 Transcript_2648/m.4759 type:complete len:158 (+) Transcript_2648:662-1135(+)
MAPTENVINHVGPGEIHDSVQGGSKRTIDAALQLSVLHDIRREAELASARLASEISTFNRRISSLLSNMEVAITGGANGTLSSAEEVKTGGSSPSMPATGPPLPTDEQGESHHGRKVKSKVSLGSTGMVHLAPSLYTTSGALKRARVSARDSHRYEE